MNSKEHAPLMFRAIDRLRSRLRGAVEFHYIGTSDPHRFADSPGSRISPFGTASRTLREWRRRWQPRMPVS